VRHTRAHLVTLEHYPFCSEACAHTHVRRIGERREARLAAGRLGDITL
jgi:hypothetical protein